MGYEIKLVVGNIFESEIFREDDMDYLSVIATLDLCKPGNATILNLKNGEYQRVYFYADDDNTRVTEDRYNDALYAVPIDIFLTAMQQDFLDSKKDYKGKGYRRFKWAKDLLTSMKKDSNEPLYVVMFGH